MAEAAGSARAFNRRQVLIAVAIGGGAVAAGGAIGAVLLTRGGEDDGTPVVPGTETPTTPGAATETPSPSTTPLVPGERLPFLEPAPDAFERRRFAPGEAIDWTTGVFYMDTSTGALTAYRLRGVDFEQATVLAGGRFVQSLPPAYDTRIYLLDRETGESWKWRSLDYRIVAATESRIVFAELGPDASRGQPVPRNFILANESLEALSRLDVDHHGATLPWIAGEGHAVTATYDGSGDVFVVDVKAASTRHVHLAEPSLGDKNLWALHIRGADTHGFSALASYHTGVPNKDNPGLPGSYVSYRVLWDGTIASSWADEVYPMFQSYAPDGIARVREQRLHQVPSEGEGSGEYWPAVEVFDSRGEPVFRIRSAGLVYGDALPDNRWLADGLGFVALVRGEEPTEPREQLAYAVVSPDGTITPLPTPPLSVSDWYTHPYNCGPAPSPTDWDLLSFGRMYLYNRRTGTWFIPNLPAQHAGPAHLFPEDSPWIAGGGEMVFALNHGGHGGGTAPALIAPLVERPPYTPEPPMRFRVAGTASCLNLRAAPGTDAGLIACLPDGTELELDPDGEYLWENATRKYTHAFHQTGAFAMVRLPDGTRGWVSTQYLEWAV